MSAFQPGSAATSDRLVNKVAMCGALFAGVAFVGYRIVKNSLSKKSRNKTDPGKTILQLGLFNPYQIISNNLD